MVLYDIIIHYFVPNVNFYFEIPKGRRCLRRAKVFAVLKPVLAKLLSLFSRRHPNVPAVFQKNGRVEDSFAWSSEFNQAKPGTTEYRQWANEEVRRQTTAESLGLLHYASWKEIRQTVGKIRHEQTARALSLPDNLTWTPWGWVREILKNLKTDPSEIPPEIQFADDLDNIRSIIEADIDDSRTSHEFFPEETEVEESANPNPGDWLKEQEAQEKADLEDSRRKPHRESFDEREDEQRREAADKLGLSSDAEWSLIHYVSNERRRQHAIEFLKLRGDPSWEEIHRQLLAKDQQAIATALGLNKDATREEIQTSASPDAFRDIASSFGVSALDWQEFWRIMEGY